VSIVKFLIKILAAVFQGLVVSKDGVAELLAKEPTANENPDIKPTMATKVKQNVASIAGVWNSQREAMGHSSKEKPEADNVSAVG
jgi:hypothetical protein